MALRKSSKASKPRKSNVHVTKSGKTIKLHTSLSDKVKANRDQKALRKAERLRGMPKSRIKRFFYRMHPKRLKQYWWSREGAIMALKITGIGIVAMFVLLVGVFAYFRKDLPNLRDISGNNIGGSIRYYDRTGQTLLWEDYDAVKRIPVESDNISDYLKQATIALEDRDFFNHGGFDMRGITRAAWANLTGGSTSQGGSTITQQLVKLSLDWSADRSYARKVKEVIIAVEMERSYSKDEILTGYLNTAPYGNIQYGAEVAAQDYFHKTAKDLTLAESVFLAAIPQAPSFYSPYGAYFLEQNSRGETGAEALRGRMNYTLDIMREMGFLTEEEVGEAKEFDILSTVKKTESKYTGIKAPHFVLAAKEELEKDWPAETIMRSGWKVTTTVDLELQKMAEEEVTKGIAQVRRQGGNVAAFVAEDVETGQIVAMVGGPDFNNEEYGENNYARMPLPPGSSFKPYDYAALMESQTNVGAGTVLYDTRGPLEGYPCTSDSSCLRNYDRRYPGAVTLRYALGGSRNVPAVKAMLIAGVDKTIETATTLMNASNPDSYGYRCYQPGTTQFIPENEAQCYSSSAIGDGAYLKMDEHVHGLATISRNGLSIPRTYILKVTDANDKAIYEWTLQGGEQAIREDTAYILSDMMSDPRASYMARKRHRIPGAGGQWKIAIKTGTTNDSKDGWITGFSSKYAAAVWVGDSKRQVEMSGFMENMTQPIFDGWMARAHANLAPKDWPRPGGVQTLPAYVVRNHIGASSIEPSPSTDLYPSWYQKRNSSQKMTLDVISSKLATECTPDAAKKEETGGSASQYSSDIFVDARTNTDEKDDVHQCSDIRPSVTASFSVSDDGAKYVIRANVTGGTHALAGNQDKGAGKIEFVVDGNVVGSQELTGAGLYPYDYTPTKTGSQAVSVRVLDSVLYENSANAGNINPIGLDFEESGPFILFTWTGGNATVFYSSGGSVCTGTNSCSINQAGFASGSSVYVRSSSQVSPLIKVDY